MNNYVLDAGMSATAAAATQVAQGEPTDLLPVLIGVFAPIIKEALFRLIDKIGTLHRERKERRKNAKS